MEQLQWKNVSRSISLMFFVFGSFHLLKSFAQCTICNPWMLLANNFAHSATCTSTPLFFCSCNIKVWANFVANSSQICEICRLQLLACCPFFPLLSPFVFSPKCTRFSAFASQSNFIPLKPTPRKDLVE